MIKSKAKTRTAESAKFCPHCGKFCDSGCPMDVEGACAACGRKPIDLGVVPLSFFWCGEHGAWHRSVPCGKQPKRECCTQRRVWAVTSAKKGLPTGAYCPGCATFCGASCPLDGKGACRRCGRPTIETAGLDLTWYWCAGHRMWHDAPCPEESKEQCCSAWTVTLPVR